MTPEETKAFREILSKIPPADADKFRQLFREYIDELFAESIARESKHFDGFRDAMGLTDEIGELSFRLANEYQMDPSEVLLKALALFKVALDAKSRGERITILDQQDEIVQEIVGLDSSTPQLVGNL